MKFKKIMLVTFLLLAILTIGAVSAVDDTNDTLTVDNTEELSQDLDEEIVSVEKTDMQTNEIDDDKLSASAKVVDNSTDESVTSVNGTLILTDIDTGDVVRKNITIGPFKSNYTSPLTTEGDTINETIINQFLDVAKIQSGGKNITIIKQDYNHIVVDEFDHRVYQLVDDTEYDGRYLLINGSYGRIWCTNITIEAEYSSGTEPVSLNNASVSVNNSTLDLFVDETFTIVPTTKPDGLTVTFVPDNSGIISVENGIVTALKEGTASVIVKVGGDGIYAENSTAVAVTVSKVPTEIILDKSIIDMKVGDDSSIEVKLPSDAEGSVTLKVDGKVVDTVDVTNGIASVKLLKLSAGKHNAEITYSGDDKYRVSSKNTTVTVNKVSTKISAADVTATYNVNRYLVIKLTDSKGNPMSNAKVSVNLNGAKNYVTDKNGQVKIKISTLVPKTYTAKITFAGNKNYIASSDSAKVVVKKATPKLTAANKMFKTTIKTKKYTITLKDNTGKAIRNAKVTLKVNGKTYKATTNSKGMATFKITKLNKKGTFKAVITYEGSKYYNKATKEVSIKVISAWNTVQKGSKLKSTVKEIQRALKNNGYYLTAYGHYLKVDGIYWDYTVKAVKQFQKAKGLKVTGKVDEKTAKKLGII